MGTVESATPATSTSSQGKCDGTIGAALKQANEAKLNFYFDKVIEVESASFEHAAKANTINITVIYAGAFLLIQNTASQIPTMDWTIIVLLLFVSLVSFAIWTVSSSYRVSRHTIRMSRILMDPNKSVDRKLQEISAVERRFAKRQLLYFATWGFVFSVTLITGFSGALYLLVFYILNLFGVQFSFAAYIASIF